VGFGVSPSPWRCPLCANALTLDPSSRALQCESGHSFDVAKEGYVNLLPSHKKSSLEPGDSAEMIAARRRVHQADIYRPLATALQQQLLAIENPANVLELGCGEGYYSNALKALWPWAQVAALDISKTAIRLAAKKYPAVNFAVASSFDIPVACGSQELLLRIFAPSKDDEVQRVLKEGGHYLELTPAPRHMWALRSALYQTPKPHEPGRTEIPGFACCAQEMLDFEVDVEGELLKDLVAMTPFAHRGHREKRERLLAGEGVTVEMAFSLRLFRRQRGEKPAL
jgi:23S rRNA (guanine745-N1)-methyltransferase